MHREVPTGDAYEFNGQHRDTPSGLPRPFGRLKFSLNSGRIAAATGLLGCLTFAALGSIPAATAASTDQASEVVATVRAEQQAASRSMARTPVTPVPTAKKAAAKAPAVKKAVAKPKKVAGLTETQTKNARLIIEAGQALNMPKRGLIVAVSTAMQESNLYNLGSTKLSASTAVPHEGVGSDHDSVGLFQQRASTGWGPVKSLMQPKFAATQFYKSLKHVPGWQKLPVTVAAQKVQVSAYPDAYAKHEKKATAIVNALS